LVIQLRFKPVTSQIQTYRYCYSNLLSAEVIYYTITHTDIAQMWSDAAIIVYLYCTAARICGWCGNYFIIWEAEELWVHFLAEVRESLLSKDSKLALEHNQPPLQWAPTALSLAVKQPPSNDEVKDVWRYTGTTSTLPCLFIVWCSINQTNLPALCHTVVTFLHAFQQA
jgi:hypothetical protein